MKIKDMVKRSIASNIRRARLNANMTQAEAAEKLGVTAQAISNFERGVNGIETSVLLRMCEIYNVSFYAITGEEKETPDQLVLTGSEINLVKLFRQFPQVQQESIVLMVEKFHTVPADKRESALQTLQALLNMLQTP